MISITITGFILIAFLGSAVLMTIGMLILIRRHRNKEDKKYDDTEKYYSIDDDIVFRSYSHKRK